ncbi:MAG: tetratricopeptide repeat protein [Candidatus Saelkia tenebricola]|nr:tetratricopeptide repeat protein [Candidatus Saelkia tenebricola]
MKNFFIKDKTWLHLGIISIVVFIVFFRSLNSGFIWLDHFQIENKQCIIKDSQGLKDVFFNPLLRPYGDGNYYRPLFKVSYTLDYLLYRDSSVGFHLSSILLHILNLVLFYLILQRLKILQNVCFISALLYGVLPLNVSTVSWLGARADLLAGFFILSSLLMYLVFEENKKIIYLMISVFGYGLALMSKEIAFPFFLLIIIIGFFLPRNKKYFIPYASVAACYILARIYILGQVGSRIELFRGTPYITSLSSLAGFFRYIFKSFIPLNLSVTDAFLKHQIITHHEVLLGVLLGIFFLCLFLYSILKKRKILTIATGWILCFYLPISNILPALHFWAERFFYLSGFGLTMLVVYIFSKKIHFKKIFLIMIGVYAVITFRYQDYFKNDGFLFNRALRVSRESCEPHTMLGYVYLVNNDYQKSIYHYFLATQKNQNYYIFSSLAESSNNLGVLFLRLGQYDQARNWFRKVLSIDKEDEIALLNLAIVESNLEKQ